jgi:hypothetical protein
MIDSVSMPSRSMDMWENEGGSLTSPSDDDGRDDRGREVMPSATLHANRRSYLFHALDRVLGGNELSRRELEAAIIHPQSLRGHENDAWEQLGHWADEADLRARDENYNAFHLDWLRDLHSKLAA